MRKSKRLQAIAVYDWKEKKLVHFEQVKKGVDTGKRMMKLQDKYYSDTYDHNKSELQKWVEDVVTKQDDPRYEVETVSIGGAKDLEDLRKKYIKSKLPSYW